MRTCRQFVNPFVNVLEAGLVGQVEAVDDAHDAAVEQLAQRFVLLLAGRIPAHSKNLKLYNHSP